MTSFEEMQSELLNYCRIDDASEDDLTQLSELYAYAVSYMLTAGVQEPSETDTLRLAQYRSCVKALVLDGWDNRGVQQAGTALSENRAFRIRVNQLKLSEPTAEA